MIAKNLNGDRRHAVPVVSLGQQLAKPIAAAVRAPIVRAEGLNSPRRRRLEPGGNELDRLYAMLEAVTPENHPRTARLLESSNRKVAQKVIEEAGEVALAGVKRNPRNIVRESADLLYHLVVLWRRAGIGPSDIWAEMRRRADTLGIAEKLPKSSA
jgi:phosphoribosyl-ATP pyrophosphohydrolase